MAALLCIDERDEDIWTNELIKQLTYSKELRETVLLESF